MLGTNGGGFFNANSAHPYENPTPLTNLLQMVSIFAIGAGLTYTFGRMVGEPAPGMGDLRGDVGPLLHGRSAGLLRRGGGQPSVRSGWRSHCGASDLQSGGNMEGKEVRFGIANSALFATVTTDASCGAVNAMHDSFTPLGGLVPLLNMELGEVIVGGVGAGFYGMLLFAILAVFIAGLMVGRTPEYLGKKIEAKEMKMTVLALVLVLPLSILGFTALASVHPDGLKGPLNAGPHGFSEILYAFVSGTGNNGSAFGGLTANTHVLQHDARPCRCSSAGSSSSFPQWRLPARSCARRSHPPSAGTFPTTGRLWVGLLVGVILIVGGLTFFPALALGPIVEHLQMMAEKSRSNSASRLMRLPRFRHELHSQTLSTPSFDLDYADSQTTSETNSLFDPAIVARAIGDSFVKLDPRTLMRNPVMFVVEVVAVVTTILFVRDLDRHRATLGSSARSPHGSGSPSCSQTSPRRWPRDAARRRPIAAKDAKPRRVPSGCTMPQASDFDDRQRDELRRGDIVLVEAGDMIPGDGDVIEGVASVNESAITGESAPVIRESGGDRSSVTGGTMVLSDWIKVRITSNPGETFIDRMIALVEGAQRAEDTERDRAQHPPLRPDDRLPAGDGDDRDVQHLCRRRDLGHDP